MRERPTHDPQPGIAQDHPDFVHALAKGLEILSAFSSGALLGNQQLVKLTGLPKATVSRLTTTLVTLGYLQPDSQTRKLRMGTRVLGKGVTVQREIGLQRIARPFMEALSNDLTGESGCARHRSRRSPGQHADGAGPALPVRCLQGLRGRAPGHQRLSPLLHRRKNRHDRAQAPGDAAARRGSRPNWGQTPT